MGTVTVGLRVTDSASQTNTTIRSVTVTPLPVNTQPATETQTQTQTDTQQGAPLPPPALATAAVKPLLSAPSTQKVLKSKVISVQAQCGGACAAVVSAKVSLGGSTIKLPSVTKQLAAGETAPLKLKIPASALGKIKAALAKKKKVTATVTMTASGGLSSKTITLK